REHVESLLIKKGPSLSLLIDAFKYAFGDANVRPFRAEFTVETGATCRVQLTSLTHESGNRASFIFEGNLVGYQPASIGDRHRLPKRGKVEGFYQADDRRGHIGLTFS